MQFSQSWMLSIFSCWEVHWCEVQCTESQDGLQVFTGEVTPLWLFVNLHHRQMNLHTTNEDGARPLPQEWRYELCHFYTAALNLCRCSFHVNGKWDSKQFQMTFLCFKVTKVLSLLWLQLALLREGAGSSPVCLETGEELIQRPMFLEDSSDTKLHDFTSFSKTSEKVTRFVATSFKEKKSIGWCKNPLDLDFNIIDSVMIADSQQFKMAEKR